jgi:hypothetical protein
MLTSAKQDEARRLASEGESWNAIARRLGEPRIAVQRFLKVLGVKKTASTEARALLTIRHEKLRGDLDAALQAAYSLRNVAEQKMDTRMLLAANKQIARILQMQSKATPRLPTAVDVPNQGAAKFAVNTEPIWPDDAPTDLIERFGGRRASEVAKDEKSTTPTIRFRVQWQKVAEPWLDAGAGPVTTEPSTDALAAEREGEQP